MVENKFIVRAELTIFKEKPTISKVPNKTLEEKTSNTDKIIAEAQALQKKEPAWERNRYTADCTIKCGDSLFPVHTHRLKCIYTVIIMHKAYLKLDSMLNFIFIFYYSYKSNFCNNISII